MRFLSPPPSPLAPALSFFFMIFSSYNPRAFYCHPFTYSIGIFFFLRCFYSFSRVLCVYPSIFFSLSLSLSFFSLYFFNLFFPHPCFFVILLHAFHFLGEKKVKGKKKVKNKITNHFFSPFPTSSLCTRI